MSIVDQIKTNANYLLQTKNLIRQAIIAQGVEVPENTPFEAYPQLVAQIGVVDYQPPTTRRNGTIAGELGQILDTKQRLREVIAQYNGVITEQTPFREYAQLIQEIVTTPTLAGLKRALNAGNAAEKYPIGTEIPDTWNGNDNPLIVAHYTNIELSDGTTKPGAYLVRKYVDPTYQAFGSNANYSSSTVKSYLDNAYFAACSDEAKETVSEIQVPCYNGSTIAPFPSKFFLMSATNVLAVLIGGEGEPWDYWKQKTGLSGNGMIGYSASANTGRVVKNRNGVSQYAWLRSRYDSTHAYLIQNGGDAGWDSTSNGRGVLPACAVVAD